MHYLDRERRSRMKEARKNKRKDQGRIGIFRKKGSSRRLEILIQLHLKIPMNSNYQDGLNLSVTKTQWMQEKHKTKEIKASIILRRRMKMRTMKQRWTMYSSILYKKRKKIKKKLMINNLKMYQKRYKN